MVEYMCAINVSEKDAASFFTVVFYPESRGSTFLRKVAAYLPDCMVLYQKTKIFIATAVRNFILSQGTHTNRLLVQAKLDIRIYLFYNLMEFLRLSSFVLLCVI
jgi:hypothetical protein